MSTRINLVQDMSKRHLSCPLSSICVHVINLCLSTPSLSDYIVLVYFVPLRLYRPCLLRFSQSISSLSTPFLSDYIVLVYSVPLRLYRPCLLRSSPTISSLSTPFLSDYIILVYSASLRPSSVATALLRPYPRLRHRQTLKVAGANSIV